jgi:hypothetical protein
MLGQLQNFVAVLLLASCSSQEFVGESGVRQPGKPKLPPVSPPVELEKPPTTNENPPSDGVSTDGGGLVSTPGTPVIKLGIGFNDGLGYHRDDRDFNDAVVCFEGPFNYDSVKKEIYSAKKQTVPVHIGSISACENNVLIKITAANGETTVTEHATNINKRVNFDFSPGSKLSVSFKGTKKNKACPNLPTDGTLIHQGNTDWIIIEGDKCRDYGN